MYYLRFFALLVCLLASGTVTGCVSMFFEDSPLPVEPSMTKPVFPRQEPVVQSGDVLKASFLYHPELNTSELVSPEGTVTFPLIGPVAVHGKTVRQIHAELMASYEKDLLNPDIVVTVDRSTTSMVYVAGEVRQGGAKPLNSNLTVAQMIASSDPDMVKGDVSSVLLIRKKPDAEQSTAYKVDARFASGDGRDVYLVPGDIVIVPRKGIVLAGDFVQQYVRDLLPPQLGLNMGFVYEIDRDYVGP